MPGSISAAWQLQAVLVLLYILSLSAHAEPPFEGTVWVDPNIITPADPTTLQRLTYVGRGQRLVHDRRPADWVRMSVHRFDARFEEERYVEVWVNPEFDSATSRSLADEYARILGRLPTVLRDCIKAIEIHGGDYPAGGNDGLGRIHIHTGMFSDWRREFVEEVMVHEAGHACETELRGTPPMSGWRAAQNADPEFISDYARQHPDREDFAETILPWIAVRYMPERVDAHYKQTTVATIPHRLAYLDDAVPHDAMFPLSSRTISYAVPFFAAADRTATGFMRIVNRSDRAGTVRIIATDDMGDRYGPVMLDIGAREAKHFNADDLERGNGGSKGLSGGVGDGEGNWWLVLTTELDIVPLVYVRTPDGFVAPMMKFVEADARDRYPVLFMNPCRNRTQVSMLRLVNPGAVSVRITVSGVDDTGAQRGSAVLELPRRSAAMYRSCQLEDSIGMGTGKWRMMLEADKPVWVINLLSTPTGHLINLSSQTPIPHFRDEPVLQSRP